MLDDTVRKGGVKSHNINVNKHMPHMSTCEKKGKQQAPFHIGFLLSTFDICTKRSPPPTCHLTIVKKVYTTATVKLIVNDTSVQLFLKGA